MSLPSLLNVSVCSLLLSTAVVVYINSMKTTFYLIFWFLQIFQTGETHKHVNKEKLTRFKQPYACYDVYILTLVKENSNLRCKPLKEILLTTFQVSFIVGHKNERQIFSFSFFVNKLFSNYKTTSNQRKAF